MRDTILMLAAVSALMAMIGYMNSLDIKECVDRGNSVSTCERSFNR